MPEQVDAQKLLTEFRKIFSGAQDKFVLHTPPFAANEKGKLGPTINPRTGKPNFVGFQKYGNGAWKVPDDGFEAGDYVPVSIDQYRAHLNGEYGVAISPLIGHVKLAKADKENVCTYGIIDIDKYDTDFSNIIRRLYADGFRFVPFRSKSGGVHLYFFFGWYEESIAVRSALNAIVRTYGLNSLYVDGKVSKVEVFPEHDEVKQGKNDKGVFLPFFNTVDKCPNKMISAEGKLVGLEKAIPFIKEMTVPLEHTTKVLKELPYADAPFCIQALLLNGELYSGMHRNDFMFTVALYLKMKHGKDVFTEEMLAEANQRIAEPLEAQEIANSFASAQNGDFPLLGQCKKEPMCSFCDKKLCRERQFSAVQKEKNNVASNIEFGRIYRMLAEEPYYLVEAKLAESAEGEFRTLRANGAEELLNQRFLQRECIDKLGQAMWTVKQQVWEGRINEILSKVEDKEVPKETDTTELSDLRGLFNRYLTHRQVQSRTPFRVTQKQVYFAEGMYYFQTDGFKDYLRIAKFILGRTNLREQLVNYGCVEGELGFSRMDGSTGTIKCWKKSEDETLKEMTVYFDEVTGQDSMVLEQNKLQKEDEGGDSQVDDTRF